MFEILICSSTVKAAVRTLLWGIRAGSSRVIDCGDVQMHSIGRAECLSLEVVRRKHSSATRKVKVKVCFAEQFIQWQKHSYADGL